MKQEDALSDSLKCLPTRRVVAGREDCVSKRLKNVQRCALKCRERHAECEFCRGEWTSGIPQGLSLPVSLVGLPSWYCGAAWVCPFLLLQELGLQQELSRAPRGARSLQ